MALDKIVEYRGCKGLVFAEITNDDNETGTGHGYITDTVKDLAGVAEISKTVSVSKVSKYYDNVAAIVITGEGEDVVTLTTSIPTLHLLSQATPVHDVSISVRSA